MLPFFWSICYQALALAIGKPIYFLISTAGASFIHFALAYYLGVYLDMKIHGLAIATSVHFFARFFITYFLIMNDEDAKKCLIPINHEDSFKGLKEMVHVGIDSFLNRVFGWWSFDVYTQLAAMLTDTDVAAQTILRIIGVFTFMVPIGIQSATNYLLGMYIGKNRVDLAKKIGYLLALITLAWSFLSMFVVFCWRDEIHNVYTKDIEIIQVMIHAWSVIVIFVFFDCI